MSYYTMKNNFYLLTLTFLLYQAYSWCFKTHFAESQQINSIDFSPDRTMVVTGSDSKMAIIWNFTSLEPISNFTGSGAVKSVRFSKNQAYVGIGVSGNSTVTILSASTFLLAKSLSTTAGSVNEIDFSWDNSRIMVCGASNVQIYYIANWTKQIGYSANSVACRFQKNNRYIFGDGGNVKAYLSTNAAEWNDNPGSTVQMIDYDHYNSTVIAVNGGGNKYFLYSSNKSGASANQPRIINPGTSGSANAVAFAKDGSMYAIGGSNFLFIYQNNTNNVLFNLTVSSSNIISAVFSYDSQYFIASNSIGLSRVYKRQCQFCPIGTYQYAVSCLPCTNPMPGCLNCANASYCYTCGDGYTLDTVNNNCSSCQSSITGCVSCNSTTNCTACSSLFYLLSNNSCGLCGSLPNCLSCANSTACTRCNSDFYLNSSSLCSACSIISNCLSCTNSTACISCVSGYYLNTTDYTCTRCPLNCTQCFNASNCTICNNTYYLNASNICVSCSANCLTCSATTCLNCISSYYYNGSSCTPCTGACSTCVNASYCLNCIPGYYLTATSTCFPCVGNCLTCSSATACLSCNLNYYYLAASSTCNKCQNLIQGCQKCSNTTCSICEPGYFISGTSCTKCREDYGCQTCQNSSFCVSCLTGFQINSAAGTCSPCSTGCASCNKTICLSCMPRYYLSSGSCLTCPYNCPTCVNATYCLYCLSGFYMNSTQSCVTCKGTISNCVTCTSNSYCTSCQLGYKLDATNSTCSKCVWPCSICNSTQCYECAVGYYLSSGSCLVCSTSCSSCINSTYCLSCGNGYYLSGTNTCVSCQTISNGCQVCNNTKCLSCLKKLGYYLDTTTKLCSSCNAISNCLECTSATTCTICSFGYSLVGSTCTLCSKTVSNCQVCNANGCLTCIDPYYLLNSTSCQLCNEGCSSCYNGTTCKSCFNGYLMQSGSCTFCNTLLKGCQICTSSTVCIQCSQGYILSGSYCVSCNSIMFGCAFCNQTSVCLTCMDQYYLSSSSSCTKCSINMPGCSQCNTSSVCLTCLSGYFKNTTNSCSKCNDSMCIICSNVSTCVTCLSGYFSNNNGVCQTCNSFSSGCILCSSGQCLQCSSGYYLNSTNQCSACLVNGCQICNQLNLTLCVTCTSLYFLNSSSKCTSCSLSMEGCVSCVSATSCISCEIKFYLAANFTCTPCSMLFQGCSQCTATACSACQGGYIMNGTTCATCIAFISGCQYCTSTTICLTCQSGYYQSSNTCISCTAITGCLDCSSSSYCNLCSDLYYLDSGTHLCLPCNTTMTGCITCASSTACKTCLGTYALSGGYCSIIKSQTTQPYQELRLQSKYINSTCLLHSLIVTGASYSKVATDLSLATVITMVGAGSTVNLTITGFQWPKNDYEIYFYTNNPLGNSFNSFFKSMPKARLLEEKENIFSSSRFLAGSNVDLNYQFKLEMTESAIQSILPSSTHGGSLSLRAPANDPVFIRSLYVQISYNYHYIGYILIFLILVVYFIKAVVTVPNSDDQGQIIPHILLLKCGGVIFSLSYVEYMDYCYGFLAADFPWLNLLTAQLSDNSDLSPNPYLLFYQNMTLANTYLGGLFVVILIGVIFALIAVLAPSKRESLKVVGIFFYNFFQAGMITGGSASIQGAYYNNFNYVTRNTILYGVGILMFLIVGIVNLWMCVQNSQRINKIRILVKATFLSLIYISPIYLLPLAMGIEAAFIFFEFQIKKAIKLHPHIWAFNQIIVNLSFVFLVFFSQSQLSIMLSAAFVLAAFLIDLYIHIREFRHLDQVCKVKEVQKLTSMLESQQKLNQKVKKRNNTIYQNIKRHDSLGDVQFNDPNFHSDLLNSDSPLGDPKKNTLGFSIEEELKLEDS